MTLPISRDLILTFIDRYIVSIKDKISFSIINNETWTIVNSDRCIFNKWLTAIKLMSGHLLVKTRHYYHELDFNKFDLNLRFDRSTLELLEGKTIAKLEFANRVENEVNYNSLVAKQRNYIEFDCSLIYDVGLAISNNMEDEYKRKYYITACIDHGIRFTSNHVRPCEMFVPDSRKQPKPYKFTTFEKTSTNDKYFNQFKHWTLEWFELKSKNQIGFKYYFGTNIIIAPKTQDDLITRKRKIQLDEFFPHKRIKIDTSEYCIIGNGGHCYDSDCDETQEYGLDDKSFRTMSIKRDLKYCTHWLVREDFMVKKNTRDYYEIYDKTKIPKQLKRVLEKIKF